VSVFANKIVVITGAGSGIGLAIANEMAARGSVIIATDLHADTAASCAAGIVARGGRAESYQLDVTDAAAVKALVERVAAAHGRLDYIFNNAGIGFAGEVRDSTVEQWRQVIRRRSPDWSSVRPWRHTRPASMRSSASRGCCVPKGRCWA
jgi:NAD(P)-dependent dehydrogenase (short-subunit alcohol dehydrogenase family)